LIEVVKGFTSDRSALALKRFGPTLARASFADLVAIGKAVVHQRRVNLTGPGTRAVHVPSTAAPSADDWAENIVNQYTAPITPVGQIHLERLEMTPIGVEHGELVHSVPLTPGETVNVTHREWSITSQTFENLTQDSFEGFSEMGVAEKSDLARASEVESQHASSLDVNGSVSATYNGGAYSITAAASVGYQQQEQTRESEKRSVAHSMAITRSASTRTKKEHKTSFRVSSVAGAEDLAVQVIKNHSTKQAMRVDYYQLLRKWRVDLIRYGLRMTYDIAIPNPGVGLVSKLIELRELNQIIVAGNTFSLDPTAITSGNWQTFEKEFGASVDPPPTARKVFRQASSVPQQTYRRMTSGVRKPFSSTCRRATPSRAGVSEGSSRFMRMLPTVSIFRSTSSANRKERPTHLRVVSTRARMLY
jgi:hypothetical protein